MSDPDQVRWRAEQATGYDPTHNQNLDMAEKIGIFAAGFMAAEYMHAPEQPQQQPQPSFGHKLIRALYVSAWAYLLYFVIGTAILVILTPTH